MRPKCAMLSFNWILLGKPQGNGFVQFLLLLYYIRVLQHSMQHSILNHTITIIHVMYIIL